MKVKLLVWDGHTHLRGLLKDKKKKKPVKYNYRSLFLFYFMFLFADLCSLLLMSWFGVYVRLLIS